MQVKTQSHNTFLVSLGLSASDKIISMGMVQYGIIHKTNPGMRNTLSFVAPFFCGPKGKRGGKKVGAICQGADDYVTDSTFTAASSWSTTIMWFSAKLISSRCTLLSSTSILRSLPLFFPNSTPRILSLCGYWHRPCNTISPFQRTMEEKPVNASSLISLSFTYGQEERTAVSQSIRMNSILSIVKSGWNPLLYLILSFDLVVH